MALVTQWHNNGDKTGSTPSVVAGAAVWLTVKDDASIDVGIEDIAEAAGCAVATLRAVAAKDS